MINFIKRKKIYIIILIILIIYFSVSYTYFRQYGKESKKNLSIIVDGKIGWEYIDHEWKNLNNLQTLDEKKEYNLYTNNNSYSNYTIKITDNQLYAFDSSYNSLQYTSPILAINSNYNINFQPITYEQLDSTDTYILQEIENPYTQFNIQNKKIQLNIDKDQEIEQIYIINCYNNDDVMFSGIYLYDNNKLTEILKNDEVSYIKYDIAFALDLNSDSKLELIISIDCLNKITYNIYQLENSKYNIFLK